MTLPSAERGHIADRHAKERQMSAPRTVPIPGYPGYQQPRFSPAVNLRGSDKAALWACTDHDHPSVVCGFVPTRLCQRTPEYAGLSFIVPFIFGGSLGNRNSCFRFISIVECDAASVAVAADEDHPERGPVGHRSVSPCPDRRKDKHLVIERRHTATTKG